MTVNNNNGISIAPYSRNFRGLEKPTRFLTKNRFLGFNLQTPDTKLRPTSTVKSKDKSSEQRFGHVNATNRNSYLSNTFIKVKKMKFGLLRFIGYSKKP